MEGKKNKIEETLDPQDWDAMRALGHRMVDDMLTYLETVRQRPVWQPIEDDIKDHFQTPLPQEPQGEESAYQDFLEQVLPHPLGNIHPRFWGWVVGTGSPYGALAEMLAATMNPNMGGGDHIPNYVEKQVLDWCKQMLDYPTSASGLLVSGGSMANLVGLTVARNSMAGFDMRRQGLLDSQKAMVLYSSSEAHSSIQKAVEMLGLGSDALRKIPVNQEYQIDLQALEEAILTDRQAGYQPFCVIGNAGTVNTGAIDDLIALSELCEKYSLWFHVDGAFGALAALSPSLKHMTSGMERAHSLAFDLHKWMYLPIEIGCILVREEANHRLAFSLTPDYLEKNERGLSANAPWFSDYGIQLSRGFRALKAWLSIKAYGIQKFGRLIQQNVDQADYLADLVENSPELESLAPAPLNIVCFRFKVDHVDDERLNTLNKEILLRLQESGVAAPSSTHLSGKFALRVAITNHRSRYEDFEILVKEVIRIGRELISA